MIVLIHLTTAKVPEQVNRKCPLGAQFYNFLSRQTLRQQNLEILLIISCLLHHVTILCMLLEKVETWVDFVIEMIIN